LRDTNLAAHMAQAAREQAREYSWEQRARRILALAQGQEGMTSSGLVRP